MKNNPKQIGVFMDHAEANLIAVNSTENKIVPSGITHHVREDGESGDGIKLGHFHATNNEAHKHNKEQNELHAYFKNLADHLMPYDEIFIIGPTTAPFEFQNYIHKHNELKGKKITVEKANYLTENQIAEKINSFFKTN